MYKLWHRVNQLEAGTSNLIFCVTITCSVGGETSSASPKLRHARHSMNSIVKDEQTLTKESPGVTMKEAAGATRGAARCRGRGERAMEPSSVHCLPQPVIVVSAAKDTHGLLLPIPFADPTMYVQHVAPSSLVCVQSDLC